jgi:DNA-binding NarL/FixJ family response regulator
VRSAVAVRALAAQPDGSSALLKDVTPEHLVAAVLLVRSGDALPAPAVARRLPVASRRPTSRWRGVRPERSGRAVLFALGEAFDHLSNAEPADRLFLSPTTIRTRIGRILSKLDLRDRVQAVVPAYETG